LTDRRSGLGFDVHPRDETRPLSLGGLLWDDHPGLAGHSDGDVVCHAVADALLGAATLGDLGERFPESDPSFRGIAGTELLRRTALLVRGAGFEPDQCDVVIVADRPAVAPRRGDIRSALARAMTIDRDRVSVKASRPEGLGLSGDGAACLALVVVAARV
jgi:2-C-methyl-D-erythritol 2,4-cyclodiphosphate synthase